MSVVCTTPGVRYHNQQQTLKFFEELYESREWISGSSQKHCEPPFQVQVE
jgi:hypothetical protein